MEAERPSHGGTTIPEAEIPKPGAIAKIANGTACRGTP